MWFKKHVEYVGGIDDFARGQIVRHKITGGRYVIVGFYFRGCSNPRLLANAGPTDDDEYDFSLYEVEPAPPVDAVREDVAPAQDVHARQ